MDAKVPQNGHRLSGADAAFLFLERKEIPLHIACVAVFEEAIPFEEFVATIDSKLHLVPRYRQIVEPAPLNIGYPHWEYDPHFNIRRHIFRMTVNSPGGEAELEEMAGRLFSEMMDRTKPLWEMFVVEGMQGGLGALIVKVHHALADGIAGTSLLRIMLDPTPEGSYAAGKPHYHPPVVKKEPSLTEAIASAIQGSLEHLVDAEAGLAQIAERLLTDNAQEGLKGLVSLLPEIATPVERLPFNRQCSGTRKFCWAEFDFADVKAIRNAVGGTVNDVVLTVVTRAVAKYVKLHGEPIENRFFRVVCPVNLRTDAGDSLGNRISFMPVTLPLDAKDPIEHLRAIALRTAIMKSVGAAEWLGIAASWLGAAPPAAQAMFWWGIPLVPMAAPLLNLICTNVPGSPVPLYSVGRRMLASYPHVPTGYELGVGIAVQSYNGKMCFGLTADASVMADVGRLRDFIGVSWDSLCRAAGVAHAHPHVNGTAAKKQHTAAPVTPSAAPKRRTAARKRSVEGANSTAAPEVRAEPPSPAAPIAGLPRIRKKAGQPPIAGRGPGGPPYQGSSSAAAEQPMAASTAANSPVTESVQAAFQEEMA